MSARREWALLLNQFLGGIIKSKEGSSNIFISEAKTMIRVFGYLLILFLGDSMGDHVIPSAVAQL